MDDDFWLRLADKLIAYGTGLYNIKRIKRLSTKTIKAGFYGLNSALRRILVHRYYHKETLQEIGNKLNMTPQGVRSRELKAYDIILKSALRTRCVAFMDYKSDKKGMFLIDDPCCDRRRVKNVLAEQLSPGIIRQLEAGGYRTMKQLCRATTNDLKKIYGIGPVALRKIQQAVQDYHRDNPRLFSH